jgi:hypothetical protein
MPEIANFPDASDSGGHEAGIMVEIATMPDGG